MLEYFLSEMQHEIDPEAQNSCNDEKNQKPMDVEDL
jgi:hypothetical protein